MRPLPKLTPLDTLNYVFRAKLKRNAGKALTEITTATTPLLCPVGGTKQS
jgi:hypothetical protein